MFVGLKEVVKPVYRLVPGIPSQNTKAEDGWDPSPPSIYLQGASCILLSLQSGLNADFIYMKTSLDGGRGAPTLPSPHFSTLSSNNLLVLVAFQWKQMFPLPQMFSVATISGSFVYYVTPQEAFLRYLRELTI